jgi:hypothetical protein
MPAKKRRKRKQPKLSDAERFQRARQQQSEGQRNVERLLYSRLDTAVALNVSIKKVIRLEEAGLLDPIKLGESRACATHYRAAQVEALAFTGVERRKVA